MDFYIHSSFNSIHLWLICQRLQNFTKCKLANYLIIELLKSSKKKSANAFRNIDVLRPISKHSSIEDNYEYQKNKLNWHFNINPISSENPYYKLDAFVWEFVYGKKINRFDIRNYKAAVYIVEVFKYMKSLTFDDIKNCNFNLEKEILNSKGVNDTNYVVNIMNKANPHIKFQSNLNNYNSEIQSIQYKLKIFDYEYKLPEERTEDNMLQTYVLYQEHNKRMVGNTVMSFRKVDEIYDVLKDTNIYNTTNIFNSKLTRSSHRMNDLMNQYKFVSIIWINKYLRDKINRIEEDDSARRLQDNANNSNSNKLSATLPKHIQESLCKYRYNLENEKKCMKDFFIPLETKIFYPDANVINKRQNARPLVEKLFRIKHQI